MRNKLDSCAGLMLGFGMMIMAVGMMGMSAPDYPRLADAVYRVEGGKKASTPYGIRFKGCDKGHPAFCRRIALNTLRNNWRRWLKSKVRANGVDYLEFLRDRYAPLSDSPMNKAWLPNVRRFYE